jgi:tetratricopeptide (TPR) repeat protein
VIRVRFSPDGERLLTASYDGTARLWKVPAGEPLGLPMAREGLIQDALFSADGRLIVTASYDGSACVWDGFSGEPITPVLHQGVRLSAAEFSPDGSRVVTGNYEGVARIWTLPRPSGDLEHLERLAKLYAGHEIDAGGAALAIAGEESRGLFQSLSAEHPEEFTAGAGDLLAWHAREAGECGAAGPWADDGRWTGVEAHLDALIAEDPGRASLHARRGHVRAALRRWEDASGDFAQAIAIDPENEHHYYPQALLRLRLGDAAGYAALCAGMFERFGGLDVAQTRDLVAWTASVGPGALRDPEAAMALAQRAVDRSPANFAFKNTLAATAYRAGRWEEAIRFLDASIAAEKKEGQPLDWVFYALAEARRGRAQEAAGWLAKARAHRDGMRGTKAESAIDRVQLRWYILLELELLVAEGEALIAAGN